VGAFEFEGDLNGVSASEVVLVFSGMDGGDGKTFAGRYSENAA
jgi:hypothetical protein